MRRWPRSGWGILERGPRFTHKPYPLLLQAPGGRVYCCRASLKPRKSRRSRRFLTRSSNVGGAWRSCCLLRSTRTRRLRHFDELPSLYMIDIAVDRNRLRHQRVASNARDVVDYCLLRVFDSEPVDKLTFRRAGSFTDIAKSLGAELRGVEAFCQQIAHYFVGKELHSAVRVVNDEPLTRTEQLVRDHE